MNELDELQICNRLYFALIQDITMEFICISDINYIIAQYVGDLQTPESCFQNTLVGYKIEAFGYNHTVTGSKNVSHGNFNTINGHGNIAMGSQLNLFGSGNIAMGSQLSVFGSGNIIIGNTKVINGFNKIMCFDMISCSHVEKFAKLYTISKSKLDVIPESNDIPIDNQQESNAIEIGVQVL
jgi:hypothetical protein